MYIFLERSLSLSKVVVIRAVGASTLRDAMLSIPVMKYRRQPDVVVVVVGLIVTQRVRIGRSDARGTMALLQDRTEYRPAFIVHRMRRVETLGHIVTLAVPTDGFRVRRRRLRD